MRTARTVLISVISVISMAACSQAPRSVQIEQIPFFWSWFQTNQQALFVSNDPGDVEHVSLNEKLKRIEEELTCEIGPVQNGKRQIAISADGIPELFPVVQKIVTAAPKSEKWKVVAFRQRVPEATLKELTIGAAPIDVGPSSSSSEEDGKKDVTEISVKDMRAGLERAGQKANITVFIKGYKKQEAQDNLALVMLQQSIGEFDMVTKVGDIRFASTQEANEKNSVPFVKLASTFDKLMAQKD